MTAPDMTNGTIRFAYLLLMRDCIKLYVSINNGIIMILGMRVLL
jgi:hypothetical protein